MTDRTPEQDFQRFREAHDGRALARVFDALAPELLLVAAHFARDAAAAEDLVQMTFLDAIRHVQRYDAGRPLLPWLIGILTNHAHLERRRQRRTLDAERMPVREQAEPLAAAEQRELAEALAAILQGLPRHYRQVLALRFVHGLTPLEIARALGCPPATVKTRLQRGVALLRQALPVGFATSVFALVSPLRGLAAVRKVLLAQAKAATSAAGLVGAVGGVLMMKKAMVICCAALLGLALWAMVPWTAPVVGVPDEASPTPPKVASRIDAPKLDDSANDAGLSPPAQRTVMQPPVGAPGSARLEFVWQDDGAPAVGLAMGCTPVTGHEPPWTRMLRSDAAGLVRLTDLPAGAYTLSAREFGRRLEIRSGEEIHQRIAVRPSVRIEGTVVDGHGRPVEGAAIRLQAFANPQERLPFTVTRSLADGTFSFASDFARSVWAQKPGHQPSAAQWMPSAGKARIRLRLGGPGGTLVGRVRAPNGSPQAGAAVIITRAGKPEPPEPSSLPRALPPVSLRTDRAGQFATTELSPGEHMVLVRAPEPAPATVTVDVGVGRPARVAIQLVAGGTVHGVLRDAAGKPLRGRIEAHPKWVTDGFEPVRLHFLGSGAETGEGGAFTLRALPPGPLKLSASAANLVEVTAELDVADAQILRWDPVLDGGRTIRGHVIGPHGEPLDRWGVGAIPIGGGMGRSTSTDHEGAFRIIGLIAAKYRVEVRPSEFRRSQMFSGLAWATTVVHPGAKDLVLRVPHTLSDAGSFTGRVVDRAGDPVWAAVVYLWPRGHPSGGTPWAKSGRDGRFRSGPLAPADYSLRVTVTDFGRIVLGDRHLEPGAEVDLGTIRLGGAGRAVVRVVTASGEVLKGYELRMWKRAGNWVRGFERTEGGSRRSPLVQEGRYTISAWGESFAPVQTTVAVVADREIPVDLRARSATPARLHFVVPQAQREERHYIFLQVQDDRGASILAEPLRLGKAHGFTVVRGFAPGAYHVTARGSRGNLHGEQSFVVAPGAHGPIDVEVKLSPTK